MKKRTPAGGTTLDALIAVSSGTFCRRADASPPRHASDRPVSLSSCLLESVRSRESVLSAVQGDVADASLFRVCLSTSRQRKVRRAFVMSTVLLPPHFLSRKTTRTEISVNNLS